MPISPNLTVVTLLVLCASRFAIPEASADEVSLQFIAFPKIGDTERLELNTGGGMTISVDLPANNFSPVYNVQRMAHWELGKSMKNAQGVVEFETRGSTPALASKTQLILVTDDPTDDGNELKLIALDSGGDGFGRGKCLFANSTKMPVGGTIGKTEFSLESNKHEVLAPVPSKEEGTRKYLFTKLYYRENEVDEFFYSSTWRYSDNARNLVFVYEEPQNQKLRLHIIRDYLDPR